MAVTLQVMKKSLALISFITMTACQSSFGPDALKNTHPAYNQSIVDVLQEQMLMNLVRLKYRDNAYFLKINSITAAMSLDSNIGVGSEFDLAPGGNILKPSLGMGYADKPTISFQPLQGEDFLKSVMSPISLDALLVMTQSGWRFERVFGLCAERMNSIFNAPRASGPTPTDEPDYKAFKELLGLFRVLKQNNEIEFGIETVNNQKQLKAVISITEKNKATVKAFASLLDLRYSDDASLLLTVDTNFIDSAANRISVRTRSILGLLFYLSQNTAVPQAHIDSGLVTMTTDQQGESFDWSQTPAGRSFKILSSEDYPKNAFLSVYYRDYWFYISDSDLESKSTLMLLTQLFGLQAGQTKYSGPTLTLPVR